MLDGNAPDHEKECAEYEKKIADAGGIQLFVGGRNISKLEATIPFAADKKKM